MNAYMANGGKLLVVILCSSFIGAFVTKNLIDEQGFKIWLYMKNHIDHESVKKRIK